MYILIDEWFNITKTNKLDASVIDACNSGYVSVIDTSNCKEYTPDGWIDINANRPDTDDLQYNVSICHSDAGDESIQVRD